MAALRSLNLTHVSKRAALTHPWLSGSGLRGSSSLWQSCDFMLSYVGVALDEGVRPPHKTNKAKIAKDVVWGLDGRKRAF